MTCHHHGQFTGSLIAGACAGAMLLGTLGAVSAHGIGAQIAGFFATDFAISDHATAKDVGLPNYPGATIDKKDGEQNNAAYINAMLGHSGFKLAVLTELSGDPPDKVAAFYRRALARYGEVVDCTHVTEAENSICDKHVNVSDAAFDLRAGEKKDQHMAAIESGTDSGSETGTKATGHGSKITLLHIRLKGQ